jgi:UDP-N-acetyl-D-mannosaminuronate dehydrogenase
MERNVRGAAFHAHELYELAQRNDAMLAQSSVLEAARARVERDVKLLEKQSAIAKADLVALQVLQNESQQHHVIFSALSPGDAVRSGAQSGVTNVGISFRGAYRDVMCVIDDLARHDALIDIHNAQIQAVPVRGNHAQVAVTIDASIYHDADAITKDDKT